MSSKNKSQHKPPLSRAVSAVYLWFVSLKLSIVVMLLLAIVLAVATLVEKKHGRDYTLWHVYNSSWFIALLGLSAVLIIAAIVIAFYRGRARFGFLLTHVSILLILAGSMLTFTNGIDGSISFAEGETVRQYIIPQEDEIIVSRQTEPNVPADLASVWTFRPGPVGWTEENTLDLKSINGIGLKILRYYPSAKVNDLWEADASKAGKAALEFAVLGADGRAVNKAWLEANPFGGQMGLGPMQLGFYQAGADALADDFLNPPKTEAGSEGVLSMHYDGRVERIPVKENIGKKILLGDKGLAVEIAEYMPNSQPSQGGKFTSDGDKPLNPMLELRVYEPGKDTPMRQIAFAKLPFLSLDLMHGWSCPVKFWYQHPSVPAATGVEFLQTPNGKLQYRVGMDAQYKSQGEIKKDGEIDVAGIFKLKVLQLLPSARHEISFSPVEGANPDEESQLEAAALVEVDVDDATEKIWLHKNDPEYSRRQISTPGGTISLRFNYKRDSLDFSLKLVKFKHGLNPGRMGDASFASVVRVIDRSRKVDREEEISMNNPLVYGKYVFYQSSYETMPDGKKISRLSVGYDPGRFLKYTGSILLCVGVFITFYIKKPRPISE